jgi:hypothetical protein
MGRGPKRPTFYKKGDKSIWRDRTTIFSRYNIQEDKILTHLTKPCRQTDIVKPPTVNTIKLVG